MEQIATTPAVPAALMENPAAEIQDFERVIQVYRPRIFRFALVSLRDHDAAQTLTQDCFWRAYKGRHHFRGDASVGTWLMQIAVNLVRDVARNRRFQFWKRANQSATDVTMADWLPDKGMSPEAAAVVREQIQLVWQATASLSERQRTVFLLRFVEDMDLLEIAAATGLKEGAVKVHLFRALKVVREKVGRRL